MLRGLAALAFVAVGSRLSDALVQFNSSFHPRSGGDISGGLFLNGSWHVFPGYTHLVTSNLVDYSDWGNVAESCDGCPSGLGTGSIQPMPGGGIAGYTNNGTGYVVSHDGMRTWRAEVLHLELFNMSAAGNPSCATLQLPLPCCGTVAGCGHPNDQCAGDCTIPGGGRDYARPLQSRSGDWFMMIGCSTNIYNPAWPIPAGETGAGATCRYKAVGNTSQLSTWSFDGFLFIRNSTIFRPSDPSSALTDEVPDFFELNSSRGVSRHVLIFDPLGTTPCHSEQGCYPEGRTTQAHNVEWRTGDWSDDGSLFAPEPGAQGTLDYGMWYAPRSVADGSNTGRRLIWGNIASDITATAVPEHPVKRYMTSLPRELSLAADAKTVLVTAPPELAALRAGPLVRSASAAAGQTIMPYLVLQFYGSYDLP
jgi:hypothetical protein